MKKILAALLLGAALAVAALPVSAQGVDSTVTMTAKGDTAAVRLDLPESTAQGVKALRLSFQVDSSEPVNAEFAFDKSLPGTVQEYRYDSDTGRMDVYVAGRDEILPTGTADLGQIKVDVSQTGTATIRLVENSLELVNGALGVTSTSTSSNGEAALEPENPSTPATPNPESPSQTEIPSQPSGSVTVTSDSDSDSQENTAQVEVVLTNPALNPTGAQTSGSGNSGSNGNTGSADEDSQQSPESDASPAPEFTKTPAAEEQQSAATSSPEQAETEQDSKAALPLVPILVVGALAVAGIIGLVVIRFRR